MARQFTGGSYLSSTTLPVSGYPFTFAAWVSPTDATNNTPVMSITTAGSAQNYLTISLLSDRAYILANNSGMSSAPFVASTTDGQMQFVAAVFESSTSRTVYLGSTGSTATASLAFPSGMNRFGVGSANQATVITSEAAIAEPTVWTAALTQAEIARMAAGVSPLSIRSASLAWSAHLKRAASPEVDLIGTNDLTVTGTAATATHPTISYDQPTFITQYKTGGDMAERKIIATLTGTVSSTALTLSTFSTGFSTTNQAEAKGILVSTITGDVMVSCAPSYTPTASNGHPVVANGPAFPIEVSRGEGFATNFRVIRRTVDATVTISLLA